MIKKILYSGFTLLEVLVSIFLLSLMAFSIIKITSQSTTTKIEVGKEDHDALRVHSTLFTIQWDLNNYYSPLFNQNRLNIQKLRPDVQASEEQKQIFAEYEKKITTQFQNNKKFSGYSENGDLVPKIIHQGNESITFLSNAYRRKNLNEQKSDFVWITYALEDPSADDIDAMKEREGKADVKSGKNLVRYLDAVNPFSSELTPKDELFPQVLMEKVISIEWRYWDRKKKSFSQLDNFVEDQQPVSTFMLKMTYLDLYDKEETLEKIFATNYLESNIKKILKKNEEKTVNETNEGEGAKE